MAKIALNQEQIARVKDISRDIAEDVLSEIEDFSSTSVERTLLRLYGVDGVCEDGTPIPNRIIETIEQKEALSNGATSFFAKAMLLSGRDSQTTADLLLEDNIDTTAFHQFSREAVTKKENELAESAIQVLERTRKAKQAKQQKTAIPPQPWRYLIVATGNIYEDRTQAESAVYAGADVIAVIRSTAQSLLDYVPFGPTTEGFGGTFATQENFRIMRDALDEAGERFGRYIRLVNYSSGLCMAEIAACAAFEDLDMLLNDSMYGILFRDINMKRTFIDQHFSRLICAEADIIINTGEDNYLTTADAIESAHTVTASQLINEALGKKAGLKDHQLGLGHAFEINPKTENAFLYELAHAQLSRQLFPEAPLKYMPPTKYKSTDIFSAHCLDAMFNLASVTTGQGIHLAGILTEAIHTPLMQDRFQSLGNINYVFNVAKSLGDEIEFKTDGFIAKRACQVLDEAETLLKDVKSKGLMTAISEGCFAGIARTAEGGKGLSGVFKKGPDYSNPVADRLNHRNY